MNLRATYLALVLCLSAGVAFAQHELSGRILDAVTKRPVPDVTILLEPGNLETQTDNAGKFGFSDLEAGSKRLTAHSDLFEVTHKEIDLKGDLIFDWQIDSVAFQMGTVEISSEYNGAASLRSVEGMAIYSSRKTELIQMDRLTCNLAANNPRQIFLRVAGLNIWESDGGGLQLGVGGRGLSPNRTANFNTRQNGYDIAADALGYPESYYTPPSEALQRIEVVRGAASLQYGTQFGGLLNFVMREAPKEKKFEVVSRQTIGSFGFFNTYNSIGLNAGKLSFFGFYQGKRGNGWRPNSGFQQHTAFGSMHLQASKKLRLGAEYTRMDYVAQQPGGLTDALYNQDPRQSIRDRNWFRVSWNLAAITGDYQLGPNTRLNTRAFGVFACREALGFLGSISRIDPGGARDLLSGEFQNLGNETRILHKYNFLGQPAAFLSGVRLYRGRSTNQQGRADSGTGPTFAFDTPDGRPDLSDHVFPSQNHAFFVENLFHLGPRLSVTPGGRFEYIQTASQGKYTQRVTDLAGNVIFEQTLLDQQERSRSLILGGIGVGYRVSDDLEAYANLSQNYRAITFNDIRVANPNFRIDPDLEDEKGFTADLGFRGKLTKWLDLDFSLFALSYRNRIGQVLAVDTTTYQYYRYRTNISASLNLGLESYIEADLVRAFRKIESPTSVLVFSNFSLIQARYLDSNEPAYDGNQVELVPPVNAKGGLGFLHKGFRANIQYGWTAAQFSDATNAEFSPNAVEGLIPAYDVMDFSASYAYKFLKVEAGLNNVLNRMYFTRRAVAYPGPGIIPADGRSVYFTLQVKI